MKTDEYIKLKTTKYEQFENTVSIADLKNKAPRTLLYGYTCDRLTHHVYIKDSRINLYIYDYPEELQTYLWGAIDMKKLVPDKRLYPETCDYEFCHLLRKMHVYLPFTKWDDKREPKQYHGKIYNGDM